MKVRVKIPEFTWHDAKGYHTVAHVGEVPAEHPEVKAALAAGHLIPSDSPPDNPKPKTQNPKSKEAS
jgi:hypothetical protein